jgi:hypothetical protein
MTVLQLWKGKNAFAPILGGGRFTQPGADGGDAIRITETQAAN